MSRKRLSSEVSELSESPTPCGSNSRTSLSSSLINHDRSLAMFNKTSQEESQFGLGPNFNPIMFGNFLNLVEAIDHQMLTSGDLLRKFEEVKEKEYHPRDFETYDGLKRLRTNLAPPYFKTTTGKFFPKFFSYDDHQYPPHPWKNQNFQKWTNTDLAKLKECVIKHLQEVEFAKLLKEKNDKLTFLNATIQDREDQEKLETMFQNEAERFDNTPIDKNSQGRKRRKRTKLSETTHWFAVNNEDGKGIPFNVSIGYTSETVEDWYEKQCTQIQNKQYKDIFIFNNKSALEKIEWEDVAEKVLEETKKRRSADDCYRTFKFAVQIQTPPNRGKPHL